MSEPTLERALVTGASSGLGREFARALAAGGTDLVVVARRGDRLEELARELKERHDTQTEVIVADLNNRDDLARVEERLATAPAIELLINNAGFGTAGPFAFQPIEREEDLLHLMIDATVRLSRAALPGMLERRRGGLINVSSIGAFQPGPYTATYAAAKAFIASFSRALHEEARDTGVNVLVVYPGFTPSEFHDRMAELGSAPPPIPSRLWISAERVAAEALGAFAKGKAEYVPGLPYRIQATLARLAPPGVLLRVSGAVMRRLGADKVKEGVLR